MYVMSFHSIPSTHAFLANLGDLTPKDEVLLLARRQSRGRGRSGRTWLSPGGGLYFSWLTSLDGTAFPAPLLAGLALCRVLRRFGCDVRVKWPNDLVVQGRKLAGVLCGVVRGRLLVSVGLNLRIPDVTELAAQPEGLVNAAWLEQLGGPLEPTVLVPAFVEEFGDLAGPCAAGAPFPAEAWRACWADRGRLVRASTAAGPVEGTVEDVDLQGGLLLRSGEGLAVRVACDEIVHIESGGY